MPVAAVIPAPIVYIKVVAVKKLVVGCRLLWRLSTLYVCVHNSSTFFQVASCMLLIIYFEKI